VVVRPTISIGISAFPDDGATADLLLRKADEALYRAKNSGRDRVRT
jgi:diguanylate cyclase (GGDEF)-like protein